MRGKALHNVAFKLSNMFFQNVGIFMLCDKTQNLICMTTQVFRCTACFSAVHIFFYIYMFADIYIFFPFPDLCILLCTCLLCLTLNLPGTVTNCTIKANTTCHIYSTCHTDTNTHLFAQFCEAALAVLQNAEAGIRYGVKMQSIRVKIHNKELLKYSLYNKVPVFYQCKQVVL